MLQETIFLLRLSTSPISISPVMASRIVCVASPVDDGLEDPQEPQVDAVTRSNRAFGYLWWRAPQECADARPRVYVDRA